MKITSLVFSMGLAVATLVSCVQMPTERQSSVDLRPQLTFSVANAALDPATLEIWIDGLQVGVVSSYLSGQQAVRVRTGTHVITVAQGSRVLLEERIYVGDGMTKNLIVN